MENSVRRSALWAHVVKFSLTTNTRAISGTDEFRQWLLHVGIGMPTTLATGLTVVRPSVLIPMDMVSNSLQALQQFVLGDFSNLDGRAILTITNSSSVFVYNVCLDKLGTEERVYLAQTTALPNDQAGEGQVDLMPSDELLQSLGHRSLPPHELRLRVGARVMLLRNLGVRCGLCNGTLMEVLQFYNNTVKVKILNGVRAGQVEYLFKVKLTVRHRHYPVTLQRLKFPIRLAFSMTINKSQGQSFDRVGIYLDRDVFSHGQLYVALSRAKRMQDIRVCKVTVSPPVEGRARSSVLSVANVVYPELLRDPQLVVFDPPTGQERSF